ncbi:hypothetical protein GCM10023162_25940 [Klenkia terrae]
MKMPARVTTKESRRTGQSASPAKVPASTTRSIACQTPSTGFGTGGPPLIPSTLNAQKMMPKTTKMPNVSAASQPMTTVGPLARALSNR